MDDTIVQVPRAPEEQKDSWSHAIVSLGEEVLKSVGTSVSELGFTWKDPKSAHCLTKSHTFGVSNDNKASRQVHL
jgi:hypothetical protein